MVDTSVNDIHVVYIRLLWSRLYNTLFVLKTTRGVVII